MSLFDLSVTSDKDYLEIFADGSTTVSTVGGGDPDAASPANPNSGLTSGSTTITHNLSSVPLVRVFYDPLKNGVWYSTLGYYSNGFAVLINDPHLMIIVTTTILKLVIISDSSKTNIPVFYRIYTLGTKAVTSDTRIDKIFDQGVDSATLGAAATPLDLTEHTTTVPHGSASTPIWSLEFSEDNSNWYSEGTDIVGGYVGGAFYYTSCYGYIDGTNFYIRYQSNYNTSKTLYVRYTLEYRQ